jgi:iron complex transport system permease protein
MKHNSKIHLEENRIHLREEPDGDEAVSFQKKENKRTKKASLILILFLIWVGVFLCSLLFINTYDQFFFSLADWTGDVSENIQNFFTFLTGKGHSGGIDGLFYQYLVVALVGAGLSACGAVFQGSFKNVLAGPSTMGVMSGGTLGCIIYLLLFAGTSANGLAAAGNQVIAAAENRSFPEQYMAQIFILAGCFGAIALVLGISAAAGKGNVSPSAMVVAGMVFSTVVGNFNMLAQYFMIAKNPADTRIDTLQSMMMGNFNAVGSPLVLLMMAVPILVCIVILLLMGGKLNLLALGEEETVAMGLDAARIRTLMILAGTILTAVVVAFCGHVGFVGFMVPLIARRLTGPDMRKLIPVSALTGAILLTVIFDAARFLAMTDSLNVITSAIGAVVMTAALFRKKGEKNHAAYKGAGTGHMER